MIVWEAKKDKQTGNTQIIVSDTEREGLFAIASLTPYKARNLAPKEFQRILQMLMRTVEVMQNETKA